MEKMFWVLSFSSLFSGSASVVVGSTGFSSVVGAVVSLLSDMACLYVVDKVDGGRVRSVGVSDGCLWWCYDGGEVMRGGLVLG